MRRDHLLKLVWNYKAAPQDLVLTLYYFHGQYAIPIHLGPLQTYNLDMASLVHSRAPEPCGTSVVNYSAACTFDGYINYGPPYASCQ